MRSTPPVLIPDRCLASYGLPPTARNIKCPICMQEFQALTTIATHIECGNCFCSPCLSRWFHAGERQACPTCRGSLGVTFIAPGYDDGLPELYLHDGLPEQLDQLVGAEVLANADINERVVAARSLRDVEAENRPTSLFLAYGNEINLIQNGQLPDLPPDVLDSKTRSAIAVRNRILRRWRLELGIVLVYELRFLEWNPRVLIYTPMRPMVRVFANIEDLADHIKTREQHVDFNWSAPNGWWSPLLFPTDSLRRAWGVRNHSDSEQNEQATRSVEDSQVGSQDYDPEWAAYCPGDALDNIIFACPRKVFATPYHGVWSGTSKPGLLRAFVTRAGGRHVVPPTLPDDDMPRRHSALLQVQPPFPELDGVGICTRLPDGAIEVTTDLAGAPTAAAIEELTNDGTEELTQSVENTTISGRSDDDAPRQRRDSRDMNYMFGIE